MTELETNWNYCGLQVVRLQNDFICVDVLPEAGAKIYNFIHKPSGRNLLWHNPHITPARNHFGASFDDNWSGGWDEITPNDLSCPEPSGDMLPDHGEVWSQSTSWEIVHSGPESVEARFTCFGRVIPVCFEKTISVREGESFCRVRYRFTNHGSAPYEFLWNIHPAMAISSDTWLDIPAAEGFTDPWREQLFSGLGRFNWPFITDRHGEKHDLRQVSAPQSAIADQQYLTNVREGWYAVTDRKLKVGFGLVFPVKVFPHIWMFRTFGGWRGLYTLILEASTGCSRDLKTARAQGQCARLAPGQTLEVEVLAVAYSGVSSVSKIESDGRVLPGPIPPP